MFGLNPWKKAIDVYLGKVGLSEPRDPTEADGVGEATSNPGCDMPIRGERDSR